MSIDGDIMIIDVENDSGEKSAPVIKEGNTFLVTQSDETTCCPICLDSWSSSGGHRLVSLKCGHLFGQLCIERWLSGNSSKCPQCNTKAKKTEIRPIYAKYISAVDTRERDDAIRLLEVEKLKRSKSEQSHLRLSMQCQLLTTENAHMRKRLLELEAQLKALQDPNCRLLGRSTKHGCFIYVRSMLVSSHKHARVISSDPHSGLIAISKILEESIVSGFGVLKISSVDSTHHEFVPLHTQPVKDICFSPHGDSTLLSCSKNKELKLTCLKSNSCAQKYQLTGEGWSCSWSGNNRNIIFCGVQNGMVHIFDIRNTRGPISTLLASEVTGGVSQCCPAISVSSVPHSDRTVAGILVSTLQGITFWKESIGSGRYTPSMLDASPGALSSVCFDANSGAILTSYRPGTTYRSERHIVSMLKTSLDKPPIMRKLAEFYGGSSQCYRARSSLVPYPDGGTDLLVCAGNQVTNVVNIWSSQKESCLQTWSIDQDNGPILSVTPHRANGMDYLCVLTDQKMFQSKWLPPRESIREMSQNPMEFH